MIIDVNRYDLLPPEYRFTLWLSHCKNKYNKYNCRNHDNVIIITISTAKINKHTLWSAAHNGEKWPQQILI